MKKILITLCITILILCSCSPESKPIEPTTFSGFYFDTYIEVSIFDKCDDSIITELSDMCSRYNDTLSEDLEISEIYAINHSSESVTVSPDTFLILQEALAYAAATDGVIDPTIQIIQKEWNFKNPNSIPPSDTTINPLLKYVDYTKINMQNNQVALGDKQMITLGFIAKGYIADSIRDLLISHNIENAIINLGGNVICMGNNPSKDNDYYTVGIEKPFGNNGEVITTVQTTNQSIVTSGVYERFFTYDGQLYYHILDTSTGYPIRQYDENGNQLYSVTIVGKDSVTCDALSTTLLALGETKGCKFINDYPGYCAIFIYSDGSISYTSNYNDVINNY